MLTINLGNQYKLENLTGPQLLEGPQHATPTQELQIVWYFGIVCTTLIAMDNVYG